MGGEKSKTLGSLDWRLFAGEAGGGLTRSQELYEISLGSIFCSFSVVLNGVKI